MNIRYFVFSIFVVLAFSCRTDKNSDKIRNSANNSLDSVFQLSGYTALMDGKLDGIIPMQEVLKNGNHGLGTYHGLDGEVVIDQGVVYKVNYSGIIERGIPTDLVPFAQVCFFNPDTTLKVVEIQNLYQHLDSIIADSTKIIAFRIDGLFKRIKTRSVEKQFPPYRVLSEILKTQSVFEKELVYGRLIGFRNPSHTKTINVPGYHMHFISDDNEIGGHVLQFEIKEVEVAYQMFNALKCYKQL